MKLCIYSGFQVHFLWLQVYIEKEIHDKNFSVILNVQLYFNLKNDCVEIKKSSLLKKRTKFIAVSSEK